MKYELIMGLETHVRVRSRTKMFCSCQNAIALAEEANENTCPFCMGYPGVLPTLSEGVVDLAVRAAQAMRCTVHTRSVFDRKSYFYPDLPASYQITQLYHPIAEHGHIDAFVGTELKRFRIGRMHIEMDAGKLVHAGDRTLCDYNRSGSPLMEIVTEPDFRSREEVIAYLEELQKVMRYAGASDADLEKGQMRCDVNISIRKKGETHLNNRVELKNLNSFSAIGRAIENEYKRQIRLFEAGERIHQETRGWDDERGMSAPQRSKEDAMDYRYFPEPDLPALVLTTEYIEARVIGDLLIDRRVRYLQEYDLCVDDARILSADRAIADYYDRLVTLTSDPKRSCSYITTILFSLFEKAGRTIDFLDMPFVVEELARVIVLVREDTLSSTGAKTVVEELFAHGGQTDEIVARLGLAQTSDTEALSAIVHGVIERCPEQVASYRGGNERLFGFFVGECMKASAGKGNPKIFTEILKKSLAG